MKLRIDPEFQALIPPLTQAERDDLECAIVAAGGAREPIDVWQGRGQGDFTIIDGHNRYAICTKHGLNFTVREVDLRDRDAVKAWMFERQITRRNLTEDQIIMLAAMRGIATTRGTAIKRERAAALAAAGKGDQVLAGKLTIALAHGAMTYVPKPYKPRAPRGPSGTRGVEPAIPEGHELHGVSTLTGQDGELKAEWNKTRIHGADEPPNPAVPEGHLIKRTSTMLRGDGTTAVQWISAAADEQAREAAMREAWARHVEMYRGLAAPTPAIPENVAADMLTIYPLGDPHIGMLSWAPETGDHFDTRIACRELLQCVRILVASAEPSERAIVCNLGDFMHAQDDANMTPGHGNKLDVDGRYAKVLDAGHVLLRGIVDAALERHAHVGVRNLPGNHDPRVAAELAMWLRAVYEREPRVTIEDPYAVHQYDRHGNVLIGWHHGDRTKPAELPALMAVDRARDWGECTERVWHTGHVHHLTRKESPGCVVESHRTMAGPDAWHAGRYRAARSLCAIGYHATFGEVSRATVNLARVRAALTRKGVA